MRSKYDKTFSMKRFSKRCRGAWCYSILGMSILAVLLFISIVAIVYAHGHRGSGAEVAGDDRQGTMGGDSKRSGTSVKKEDAMRRSLTNEDGDGSSQRVAKSPEKVSPSHHDGDGKSTDTILFFYSHNCGFCKGMHDVIDKAVNIVGKSNILLRKVDIVDNLDLAEKYDIRGVPTLLRMHDGEVIDTVQGGGKDLDAMVQFCGNY